ncbi:hypothetical protein DYU11_18375 [Fibrisoma montanum]|uniref:Uncharacterized protein n=1 Tax=Fibrisoma montanum TaxID=2305895 RepID=A0A418M666_9BACT|nr:hypothetical protein [Fibrisoma montanum]RIV21373.1 hypothetical protein DYU11_18375 [Fibrisoma montanum]
MNTETNLPVETSKSATENQLAEWKKKHGDIFAVEFEDNEGQTLKGYFRKPNRTEMNFISTFHNQPFKMQHTFVSACWLGGDKVIMDDDRYMLGAAQALNELMEVKRGELKKL